MKKVYNLLVLHINHDNASNLLQSNHNNTISKFFWAMAPKRVDPETRERDFEAYR